MTRRRQSFGQCSWEERVVKNVSLRKVAGLVGVSPAHLSQVEKANGDPLTAEAMVRRVKKPTRYLEGKNLAKRIEEDSAWFGRA